MRRIAIALAALLLAASQAIAAGAFVTRQVQDGSGNHTTQFYDMSGTGIGPFLPVYVCSDGAGNVCAAGGSVSGAAADQTGSNASDGQTTSTANQHALAFLYAFNGTSWDRVRASSGVISMSDATTQSILNSIKTILGLPFQAGGSIGNTGFNALQGGAANASGNPFFTQDTNAAQTITAPGTAPTKAQGVQSAGGAALGLDSSLQSIKTTLGSPFQAGGSIGNTAFGISGTLPAFAATPTFNLSALPPPPDVVATSAALDLTTVGATVAIPLPAGVSTLGANFSGVTAGGATVVIDCVNSGGVLRPSSRATQTTASAPGVTADTSGFNTIYNVAGCSAARMRTTVAGTSTATVQTDASYGTFTYDGSNGPASAGAAAATAKLGAAVYNSTSPTLVNGQQAALQADTAGNLKINLSAGAGQSQTAPLFASESAANLATSQATATVTAAAVCAARTGRRAVTIQNLGTTAVSLGASGVTTLTGALLPGTVGASITIPTSAAIYGIVGTGTDTVACLETY